MIFYFFRLTKSKKNINYFKLLILLAIFIIIILYFFFSTDRGGSPIFLEFFVDNPGGNPLRLFNFDIFFMMINPYAASSMIFYYWENRYLSIIHSFILFGFLPLVWVIGYLKTKKINAESINWFIMYLLTILTIFISSKAWSIHHIILSFPFLVLSFFSSIPIIKQIFSIKIIIFLSMCFLFIIYFSFLR